jgi:hypothetical protein
MHVPSISRTPACKAASTWHAGMHFTALHRHACTVGVVAYVGPSSMLTKAEMVPMTMSPALEQGGAGSRVARVLAALQRL